MQGYLSRCQLHNATPGNIAETLAGGKMQQTPFPGEAWQFYSFRGCRLGAPPTEGCGKGLVLLGPGWERKRMHAWHTMLYDLLYKQWDCERNPQRQCDVIAETCVVGERIRRTSWIETSSELLRRS